MIGCMIGWLWLMQLDQAGADADQQANMDEALQRLSMARAQAGSARNERYAM